MQFDRKFARVAGALAVVAVVSVGAIASAGPPPGKGKPPKEPPPPPPATEAPEPEQPESEANDADADFVAMMIPHHHQATVMSQLAPSRSGDSEVQALAERIDVEQDLEISMMQSWQEWNGLEVTDAAMAYEMMLDMPMMVEQMGMATREELDTLAAASGTEFDQLYLQLMMEHHEGALAMLESVLVNGQNVTLSFWATDMMVAQQAQTYQMEDMLARMS